MLKIFKPHRHIVSTRESIFLYGSKKKWVLGFLIFVFCLPLAVSAQQVNKNVTGQNGMVVSARAEASRVGLEILMKGGNAFDAAIAVHFALAVVYPQAGNIGGGGFMLARTGKGENIALDFREKAPASANKDMYLDPNGNVIPDMSILGHMAVGIPGSVDGMETIYKKYGTLPWADLVMPAVELAEKGFVITELDVIELNKYFSDMEKLNPYNKYLREKQPFKAGDTIVQTHLSMTLRKIAQNGRSGFYDGPIASMIVKEMKRGGGILTFEDLQNYHSVWRVPLTGKFNGYDIITMPPPSSGGIALLQMLHMLEKLKIKKYALNSAEYMSLIIEVERLAYADRSHHMGDPDFYNVNSKSLLDPAYLKKRYANIKPLTYTPSVNVTPGNTESEQTTHFSITDKFGNAVSITTTLNSRFGCKVFVTGAGFLLNNEMDDFSSKPGVANQFGLLGDSANAIQPGKRMLSSMTPTIVCKGGKIVLVTGSPGGATIITSVLQNILHTIAYKKSLQEALMIPRFHHQWYPDKVYVEEGWKEKYGDVIAQLQKAGYPVEYRDNIGRVDAILKKGKIFYGGGDPRGDDAAAGY
jgi:gamma-glutamyltranspeptidase/glutathione hydrolase